MSILNRNDQSGRSMVEMLGVLAIIGVLSVGGISGYSKAMAKYKLIKAQDQITMLIMNIRAAYATSPSYSGINEQTVAEYNLAPNEMVASKDSGKYLISTFGEEVGISPMGDNNTYFQIKIGGLGKEACRSLASSDWGADGLVMMGVNEPSESSCSISGGKTVTAGSGGASGGSGQWCVAGLPASLSDVADACNNETNYIAWTFY